MNEQEIKQKLEFALQINSELPELELKTASNNIPKDIWRSISAMSHRKGGGAIIFGVKENVAQHTFEIVGCNDLNRSQQKLIEYFNDKMSFVLRPQYFVIPYHHDKNLFAVYVPECPQEYKPCYFKPVGLPNGAYMREGHTNRPLTDNEFRTYVALSKQFQFDLSEAPNVRLEDLSEDKITALLQKREEEVNRGAAIKIDNELLRNIGIVGDFNEMKKPTLAGFLIFSKDIPQQKYPYERYVIRCVKFSGNDSASSIIDKLDVAGTLDHQIDESYKFILRNIRKTAHIVGTKRQERYEYPEQAIRELVANAVIHRDYKITETFTQIHIFKDRLEITNPGSLPPGITVENIKDAQYSRNAIIAGRLKDLDYLEEYGRGIDIVFNKMEEWGLPAPLFRNSVNSFQSMLLGEKFRNLSIRQHKIIDSLLIKGQLTIRDCLKILKGTPRVTINSDLRELKELEIIEQKGASVNTYYVIAI
ncbi:MAG: putative DNA binding domain-containing protein [Candidatus Omnitrophica bacterium]|nr:putative DNA binding domain-containing protein [Candidatus Omnitrophota bacterium]